MTERSIKVVVTDYPDKELIENLRFNIENWSSRQRLGNIEAEVCPSTNVYCYWC
jgi:hypothetical protein